MTRRLLALMLWGSMMTAPLPAFAQTLNQAIRRLERLEGDLLAERHARIDDLALLVDLVSSGWKGVSNRLDRLELAHGSATVHQLRAG